MKTGIEDGDLRNVRPENAIHGLYCFELEAIVRGCKLHLLSDDRSNFRSQQRAFAIERATVHDAMTDDIDFRVLREKRFERRLEISFDGAQMRAP